MDYDIIIIGSGPGGYVAAIRASQLGFKTAIVERAELGGICLNWGCIPTKSLLKSAQVFNYVKNAAEFGVTTNNQPAANFAAMVARSRTIADNMSKGIQFLLKKNNVTIIQGFGKLVALNTVEVNNEQQKQNYTAKHIILATGAKAKQLPNLPVDGNKIISYRKALTLDKQPETMIVVGSGAIGSEFAWFYSTIGTKVTLVEYMPNILPNEDVEVSKQLERSFKKQKINVLTNTSVQSVDTTGQKCKVTIQTAKGLDTIEADIVLSAVGVEPNTDGIGIEELGIDTKNKRVKVDSFYRTNLNGIYAIGDIIETQSLAHVASAEAICCVEKIAGLNVSPVDYNNIPGCTYTTPEVSSVGLTEKAAVDAGYTVKTGKFPFMASGKATAAGMRDGFVKLVFDADNNLLLGAHLIGSNVTELVAELVVAKNAGLGAHGLLKAIHPHPTMSEAIMEAAAQALGEAVHL